MTINRGGEHTPHLHQPDKLHQLASRNSEDISGPDAALKHQPQPAANPGEDRQPDVTFDQQPVQAYIDYLDDRLDESSDEWHSRPLTEGFRWFLEDALGVETDRLSDDEQRCLAWLAGWDHSTVSNVGQLFNRARSVAYEEGRTAGQETPVGSDSDQGQSIPVRVEAS